MGDGTLGWCRRVWVHFDGKVVGWGGWGADNSLRATLAEMHFVLILC
jgi:hypothetical protein